MGGEGSACDTDSDCFDPLLCNFATWTCTAGGQGDPCRYAFHDCQEGLRCNVAAGVGGEGLCWASLSGAEGDPCERLEDCQRPLVCQPSGRYGVCAAP